MQPCTNHLNAIVVYDHGPCPLCQANSEREQLAGEVAALSDEVDGLREEAKDKGGQMFTADAERV